MATNRPTWLPPAAPEGARTVPATAPPQLLRVDGEGTPRVVGRRQPSPAADVQPPAADSLSQGAPRRGGGGAGRQPVGRAAAVLQSRRGFPAAALHQLFTTLLPRGDHAASRDTAVAPRGGAGDRRIGAAAALGGRRRHAAHHEVVAGERGAGCRRSRRRWKPPQTRQRTRGGWRRGGKCRSARRLRRRRRSLLLTDRPPRHPAPLPPARTARPRTPSPRNGGRRPTPPRACHPRPLITRTIRWCRGRRPRQGEREWSADRRRRQCCRGGRRRPIL